MQSSGPRRSLPLWRSILFVPAISERLIASALRQPADALQIDLEDSVLPEDKGRAREAVGSIARRMEASGKTVFVRVNRAWRHLVRDLEASVCASVCAITLAKVPDGSFVRAVAEILSELEDEQGVSPGHTRLIAMIEDPRGLQQIDAIASAHDRLAAIILGAEDLAQSMHTALDEDLLLHANLLLLTAARAAGIRPLGYLGSVADYQDPERLRAQIARARSLGFEGAFCIHPSQIAILNQGFAPSAAELQAAGELLEAWKLARSMGKGAFAHKGRMVDRPIVEQAQRILDFGQRQLAQDSG